MTGTKLACPHCQAILKSTKRLAVGKRITCLKCRQPFTFAAEMERSITGESHDGTGFLLAETQAGTSKSPMAGMVLPEVVPGGGRSPVLPEVPQSPFTDEAPPLITVPRSRHSRAGRFLALAGLLLAASAGIGLAIFFPSRNRVSPDAHKKLLDTIEASLNKNSVLPPPQNPASKQPKKVLPPSPPEKPKQEQPAPEITTPLPLIKVAAPKQEKINEAIFHGTRFLKETIQPSGTWMPALDTHAVGYAALPGLALLECKVPPRDPAIQRAAKFVRGHVDKLAETYDLGAALLFLDRLGDPADRQLIHTLAMRLVAGQTPSGGWGYQCPVLKLAETRELADFLRNHRPRIEFLIPLEGALANERRPSRSQAKEVPGFEKKKPPKKNLSKRLRQLPIVIHQKTQAGYQEKGRDDNSNTHFGLLALWAARRHGFPAELSLALAAKRFQKTQHGDGGWGYVTKAPSKNTMTCVGLLGLAMGHGSAAEIFAKAAENHVVPKTLFDDPYVKDALHFLGQYVDGNDSLRGLEARIDLYYLWSLERVGMLYRQKSFGKKDWYTYGAKIILKEQKADGRWQVHYDPPIDTSFALLFLKRADLVKDLTQNLKFYLAIPGQR